MEGQQSFAGSNNRSHRLNRIPSPPATLGSSEIESEPSAGVTDCSISRRSNFSWHRRFVLERPYLVWGSTLRCRRPKRRLRPVALSELRQERKSQSGYIDWGKSPALRGASFSPPNEPGPVWGGIASPRFVFIQARDVLICERKYGLSKTDPRGGA